jgi:hypothetical protein
MEIDNVDKAVAVVKERKKIDSFISAFESDSGDIMEFIIEYLDWEIIGHVSKALIKDALVDRKTAIEKELAELGVEV